MQRLSLPPVVALSIAVAWCGQLEADRPLVIAHRGASGYLPEHSLEAAALAHGMGADYVEQDVVLTSDAVPVVLHDIHLDTVTDVASVFPGRARDDGRYYAIDFSLAEIKSLQLTERIDLKSKKAVYPKRFPVRSADFEVPTLAEEIELIQGLNASTSRNVGIYVEVKSPAWHRGLGHDISRTTLGLLNEYGYRTRTDRCFVQCFDPNETRRIRRDLGCDLRVIQLIGDNAWGEANTDFDALRTPAGLAEIATYADGIGPWLPHIVTLPVGVDRPQVTTLVRDAHAVGLDVHPFTFRADSLPEYAGDFNALIDVFVNEADVDGLFTDFPDRARASIDRVGE